MARLVSVSTRTANRILNKLKNDGIMRFSIICNPAAMKGLVVFGLLIYVNDSEGGGIGEQKKNKNSGSHKVLERLYTEFPEYPFLRSPLISHDNIVIVSVFGNDVFAIDWMRSPCAIRSAREFFSPSLRYEAIRLLFLPLLLLLVPLRLQ